MLEAHARYRATHREKINKYGREYYYKNKEKVKERHRIYWIENKEKLGKKNKEWKLRNKEKIREKGYGKMKYLKELLGNCCSTCGYNKEPKILQFHHLRDKKFNLSSSKSRKLERDLEEIKKCVLLCPNCHWELHTKKNEQPNG